MELISKSDSLHFQTVIPGRGRNTYNSSSYSTNETRQNTIKIIGGVETDKYEFPFIVSLSRQGRHFCGGSIIDREWVLTAGEKSN